MMTTAAGRSYFWLFLLLACLGFGLDQGSKYGVFATLYNDGHGDEMLVVPGVFKFIAQFDPSQRETGPGLRAWLRTRSGEVQPRVNHGAIFGFGGRNDHGHDANSLFAVVSLVAALAIVFWGTRPHTIRDRWLSAALGLILAGTLGNLFDRLVFEGVRDFLYWYYLIDWPVFNLADCFLVCGAGMLMVQAFWACPVSSEAMATCTGHE